jgi:hypothetical protein
MGRREPGDDEPIRLHEDDPIAPVWATRAALKAQGNDPGADRVAICCVAFPASTCTSGELLGC